MDKPDYKRRKITCRTYLGINIKEFMEYFPSSASEYLNKCNGSVDELVEAYNKDVQSIINHLVPSCSKLISLDQLRNFGGKQR